MRSRNPNWTSEGNISILHNLELYTKKGIADEDLVYTNDEGRTQQENELLNSLKLGLYINLAHCYFHVLDLKNSRASCKEALRLDPSSAKGLHLLAKTINSDSTSTVVDLREALENLKRACTLDPSDHEIQQDLAKAKMQILKMSAGQSIESQVSMKTPQQNYADANRSQAVNKSSNDLGDKSNSGSVSLIKPTVKRIPDPSNAVQTTSDRAKGAHSEATRNVNNEKPCQSNTTTAGAGNPPKAFDFSAEIVRLRKYNFLEKT